MNSTSHSELARFQVLKSRCAEQSKLKYLLSLHTILFRKVSLASGVTIVVKQRTQEAVQIQDG